MTKVQEAYENMSTTCVDFLNDNPTITATLPNFAEYFKNIQQINAKIHAIEVAQQLDKSGDTIAKSKLKDTLIIQTIDVSNKVLIYARYVKNDALITAVNWTKSDLKRESDQKFISTCQIIHDTANANLSALATYGVTADLLNNLELSISKYNEAITKERLGKIETKETTNELKQLFKALIETWDDIDYIIKVVEISQPQFFKEYAYARKVIEHGTTSLSLKIKVNNAATGAPEPNVNVVLTDASGGASIIKRTAELGGCNYKNLAEGVWTVEASKLGFKKVVEKVNVIKGELSEIGIMMEAE